MKKIIISGIVSGVVLLLLSILGLHITIRFFPSVAVEYFDPAFDAQSDRIMIYYIHPFVVSLALSWFWSRFKGVLTGSFITRGIEFGLIYVFVATLPMMLFIFSVFHVSLFMIFTWFVLALFQGIIAGLVFEKINP